MKRIASKDVGPIIEVDGKYWLIGSYPKPAKGFMRAQLVDRRNLKLLKTVTEFTFVDDKTVSVYTSRRKRHMYPFKDVGMPTPDVKVTTKEVIDVIKESDTAEYAVKLVKALKGAGLSDENVAGFMGAVLQDANFHQEMEALPDFDQAMSLPDGFDISDVAREFSYSFRLVSLAINVTALLKMTSYRNALMKFIEDDIKYDKAMEVKKALGLVRSINARMITPTEVHEFVNAANIDDLAYEVVDKLQAAGFQNDQIVGYVGDLLSDANFHSLARNFPTLDEDELIPSGLEVSKVTRGLDYDDRLVSLAYNVMAILGEDQYKVLVREEIKSLISEDDFDGIEKKAESLSDEDAPVVTDGQKTRPVFSSQAYRKLQSEFTRAGMGLFDLYEHLRDVFQGQDLKVEDLYDQARSTSRLLNTKVSTETKDLILERLNELRPLFNRVEAGQRSRGLMGQIATIYGKLITDIAQERAVFLSEMSSGLMGWPAYRVMSADEEQDELLRQRNPDLDLQIQRSKDIIQKVEADLARQITEAGMKPVKRNLLGMPVMTGVDEKTGETIVFDLDGDMLSTQDYVDKQKAKRRAQKRSERIFPNLENLRKMSEEELNLLTEGDPEYRALTDDKTGKFGLTRIYPVKRTLDGDLVIVNGRFRGVMFSDMVNESGRMIEGVAFDYDPKLGRPTKIDRGSAVVDNAPTKSVSREPYVTVHEGKLYLRLPTGNNWTKVRGAMSDLTKVAPDIKQVAGSRKASYIFEPKDFAAVRETLGGLALSSSSAKLLDDYFKQLAKDELAVADKNLWRYNLDRIGGFKPGKELYKKQKEALAWISSRSYSGICALDVGVGKTLLTVAAIQKMERDGLRGAGQKFLYVCPNALQGNLPKEAVANLEDPKAFLDNLDIMSYQKFTVAVKKDPDFASRYAAIFFDEAQALKNPTSATARAAQTLNHPRKVLLTASPMEKSPMEVFCLAAISNNVNLNTKEGRAAMRAFRKRFAEEVGGKIIGIKDDPVTARDLKVWVKRNLFHADKRDVEEVAIPQLRKETVTVTMNPEIEVMYRESVKNVEKVLRQMVSKYRDGNKKMTNPLIEQARIKFSKLFRTLYDLSNQPGKFVPGLVSPKIEQSVDLLDQKVSMGGKTLFFTDSPDMARTTAIEFSRKFPSKSVAECQSDVISVWRDEKVAYSFRQKQYTDPVSNTVYPEKEWKTFALRMVSEDQTTVAAILTSTYSVGQNLQTFDHVVHLDHDSWNNEIMNQRTGRAYRNGQQNSVSETTFTTVYSNPKDDLDATLDEISQHIMALDSRLFEEVIIESQSIALGKEWVGMQFADASMIAKNMKLFQMAMSPLAQRAANS